MEAEVEGVEVWRCVSLPADLEGVGWTVELAACGISVRRDLLPCAKRVAGGPARVGLPV